MNLNKFLSNPSSVFLELIEPMPLQISYFRSMSLLFTISATCHWNLEKLELYHSVMFSVKSLRKPQLHVGLSCQFILLHLPLSLSTAFIVAAAIVDHLHGGRDRLSSPSSSTPSAAGGLGNRRRHCRLRPLPRRDGSGAAATLPLIEVVEDGGKDGEKRKGGTMKEYVTDMWVPRLGV